MPKDILLCNPATFRTFLPGPVEAYPLLGLGYLASYLENNNFSAGIFDAPYERNNLDLFRRSLDAGFPRVVGIYGHIRSRLSAFAFAREAHRRGLLTVAGGPDASGYFADYLNNGFDIVVRGEGEESLRELLEWTQNGYVTGDLKTIMGLAYISSAGKIITNAPRPYLENIDLLPPPRRDESVYAPYLAAWHKSHGFTSLPIMGARGCPYDCAFCYRPVFGRHYRKRSPALIVAEIEDCVSRFGARHFRFIDDTFVVDKDWVHELSGLIRRSAFDLNFDILARAELITPDMAGELKAMGVRRVSLGIESGSNRVLRSMRKGIQAEDSKNAARILREQDIGFLSWVMLGYPGEDRDDIRLTRDLLTEIMPDSTSISIAIPLKGTSYYAQEYPLTPDNKKPSAGDDGGLRARRRYSRVFYIFTRYWLLLEIAEAKARVNANRSIIYFLRPAKWICLAGMSLCGFQAGQK